MTPTRIAINRLLSMHGVTTDIEIEEEAEEMILASLGKNVQAVYIDSDGALCIDFDEYE